MVYADRIQKSTFVQFGGLNHNLGAADGELWDMTNLSSDLYPLLSPRKQRYKIGTLTTPNGLYCHDGVWWVDGTALYRDGVQVMAGLTNSRKRFVSLGAYIIILPDWKYYNVIDGTYGSIEESTTLSSCKIKDGTYGGEAAAANTIYSASGSFTSKFRPGDAITISGATVHPVNNQTIIVREVTATELRFYENSFVIGSGGDTERLTLARTVPADLKSENAFVCENENRLWACAGDTIYASKLGDPFNWNVFDGVATDSYAVNVGSAGDFTGCCSYLGYPVFFKEENIYKVYGDRPATFQVMGSASLGIETGSDRSAAIAGETLFYLARTGIVVYSGGIPQNIAAPFGTVRYKDAVGGSDGTKYYVSMRDSAGYKLFVYDTRLNQWHKEDNVEILDFGWDGELYFLDSTGKVWLNGNTRTVPAGAALEAAVPSMAEFGDFVYCSGNGANQKGTSKLQIRIELDTGASVAIDMQFDSDGVWRSVKTLTATQKRSYYLPIIPRRSDHFRIRFTGTGSWRLYSLVHESYSGSELRGANN